MDDWKDALMKLRGNPDLPEGEDVSAEEVKDEERPKDRLKVVLDKKGRKGKMATIVEGFTCPDDEVAELAARLKKRLGVGGSSRAGEILIQGDCAEKVRELLRAEGYKV